jgi:hypothetical protein
MEVWTAIISAFGAALGGGIAVWLAGLLTARRQASANVKRAAFACFVRLKKIAAAEAAKLEETRHNELRALGYDLDMYRDAVGARPPGYGQSHERALLKGISILIEHDLTDIEGVAEQFKALWVGK